MVVLYCISLTLVLRVIKLRLVNLRIASYVYCLFGLHVPIGEMSTEALFPLLQWELGMSP